MFGDDKCSRVCLGLGAVFGLLIALLAYLRADFNMVISLILGVLAFGVGYWVFKKVFCGETSEAKMSGADRTSSSASSTQPVAAAAAASASPTSATAASGDAASASPATTPAASSATADAPSASSGSSAKTGASESSWTDSISADSGKAGDTRGATGLKPSATLADEETLRDGVGSWKYEGEGNATSSTAPAAASAEPAAAPTESSALEGDYDGDGVVEGTDEGEKPVTLTEAREGGADDLKQIKGVGPKMEKLLNSLGFFHFDQVASWSDQEVAWVDANLEGFKGRVSRDNWVAQAKILADGGVTEFSKKVEDGGVY